MPVNSKCLTYCSLYTYIATYIFVHLLLFVAAWELLNLGLKLVGLHI